MASTTARVQIQGELPEDEGADRPSARPLFVRIFLLNAAIFVVAAVLLALSPATVSAPIVIGEVAILVFGLAGILFANFVLLQRALAPLRQLATLIEAVEPTREGQRIPEHARDEEIVRLTAAYNDMLDRLEGERRESVRATLAAQEGERARVARELHDEIGQQLTAHLLKLDGLHRGAPPGLRDEIAAARERTRETLEEVREVARRLRPEALDDLGLRNALAALCRRIDDGTTMRVEHRLDPGLPALSDEEELVLYRVAQEALTNAIRHSGATLVELELLAEGGAIRLSVSDDGRGMRGARSGAGIGGMRERALLVSGALSIRPRPGGGTEVSLGLDPAGSAP